MSGHYSYPLNDDRELLMDRLMAKLDSPNKSDVIDAALKNLDETIRNHEEFDGNPELAKQFNTQIVRSHYRTNVEVRRP